MNILRKQISSARHVFKALLPDLDYSVLLNLKKYSIEARIANIWTLMHYGAVGLLLCSMWSKSSIYELQIYSVDLFNGN